jgi:hypothetical protein
MKGDPSSVQRPPSELAVSEGQRMARRFFSKRGDHSEVHLREAELAALLALSFEQGELQGGRESALQAARAEAWCDMLSAFSQKQREQIAQLLAHKCHIGTVVIRNTNEGRDYSHTIVADGKKESKE